MSSQVLKSAVVVVAMGGALAMARRYTKQAKINAALPKLIGDTPQRSKPLVDRTFFNKLIKLIKIVVPSVQSKEFALLMAQLALLITRTFLSIRVAVINGSIVEAIVSGQFNVFLRGLGYLGSIAIPASSVNSAIKWVDSSLALSFRRRLVLYYHERYFKALRPYQVSNIESRIANVDQALTETIEKWSSSLSTLFSNVTKPLFDIALFTHKLGRVIGYEDPISVIMYYFLSGTLIRAISPKFATLTSIAQRLEGRFRHFHNRLIAHSEEVSFYNGEPQEKLIADQQFDALSTHLRVLHYKHFQQGIVDSFLIKYGAIMVGYTVLGMPVFRDGEMSDRVGTAAVTREYIANSSLLISLAEAIGRIIASYKNLQTLAGYTDLVAESSRIRASEG